MNKNIKKNHIPQFSSISKVSLKSQERPDQESADRSLRRHAIFRKLQEFHQIQIGKGRPQPANPNANVQRRHFHQPPPFNAQNAGHFHQ